MATVIEDPEVEVLARRCAALRHVSVAEAVRSALQEALERDLHLTDEERERRRENFWAKVRPIQERVSKLPILDPRHPDDILYDEDGIPH